jgi:hypothetical protein
MIRILLSVVLFIGVLALCDYALTGGDTVEAVSRYVARVL